MEDGHDTRYLELDRQTIERILAERFREVYSENLGRKVYVLKEWVEKPVFKRHQRLFGHTDIGWTVKHPKQLIRALIREGVWELNSAETKHHHKNKQT